MIKKDIQDGYKIIWWHIFQFISCHQQNLSLELNINQSMLWNLEIHTLNMNLYVILCSNICTIQIFIWAITNIDLNICHSIFENAQTKILYDRDHLNFARSSIKYEWNTLKTFLKGRKIHFTNKRNYILNTCTLSIPSSLRHTKIQIASPSGLWYL